MRNFIYQTDENTCGLACLRMLLVILKKERNYRYLTLEEKPPYSLLALKEAARKEGVDLVWKEADRKSDLLSSSSWPLLLIMEGENSEHMVLAKKSRKDEILIYDPARGSRWLKGDDFIERWTGKFGDSSLILGEETRKIKKNNPFPLKDYLIPMALSTLSIIFMALAFFFIKDDGSGNDSYLFPLIFFALFAISFLFKRNYMMAALKRFDENHLQEIYEDDLSRFKRNYERYYSFKKTNYPDYIALYEGLLSTIALFVLFGLNDFFFILGGMLVLLYEAIVSLLLRRRMNSKEREIGDEEALLFSKKGDEDGKREIIRKLNEESYRFGNGLTATRLIGIFFILVLSIFHLLYNHEVTLNFYLFNVFSYWALSDAFKNVFAFFENGKERQIDFLYFLENFDDHPSNGLYLGYEGKK